MNLSQYRLALDAIVRPLAAAVIFLVTQSTKATGDEVQQKKLIVKAILPEIQAARKQMWRVAGEFLISQAKTQGESAPVYVPPLSDYTEQAARTVVDDAYEKPAEQRAQSISATAVRHAENTARRTVVQAAEDDPHRPTADDYRPFFLIGMDSPGTTDSSQKPDRSARPLGWARQLTGADNCAFCVMLASRGPVYSSAKSAGRIPASLKWADAKGYLNAYHDHCDCLVVPVFKSQKWPGRAEATRLYKMWIEVTKGHSQNDALNALRRHLSDMDRHGEQISPDIRVAA